MNKRHTGTDRPSQAWPATAVASGSAAAPPEDLSAEVAGALERQPGDAVRCTRIGDVNYRCNWWAAAATAGYDNPGMSGLVVTTHRVRRSQFLHATKADGRLVISDRDHGRRE